MSLAPVHGLWQGFWELVYSKSPWAFPGPSPGPPPHTAPPPAAEGEKLTMKLIWCLADKICLKTNLFGAWGAQGLFGGVGLVGFGFD